jgi:hypothetical protein
MVLVLLTVEGPSPECCSTVLKFLCDNAGVQLLLPDPPSHCHGPHRSFQADVQRASDALKRLVDENENENDFVIAGMTHWLGSPPRHPILGSIRASLANGMAGRAGKAGKSIQHIMIFLMCEDLQETYEAVGEHCPDLSMVDVCNINSYLTSSSTCISTDSLSPFPLVRHIIRIGSAKAHTTMLESAAMCSQALGIVRSLVAEKGSWGVVRAPSSSIVLQHPPPPPPPGGGGGGATEPWKSQRMARARWSQVTTSQPPHR